MAYQRRGGRFRAGQPEPFRRIGRPRQQRFLLGQHCRGQLCHFRSARPAAAGQRAPPAGARFPGCRTGADQLCAPKHHRLCLRCGQRHLRDAPCRRHRPAGCQHRRAGAIRQSAGPLHRFQPAGRRHHAGLRPVPWRRCLAERQPAVAHHMDAGHRLHLCLL